jgi:hypothetical protein
MPLGLLARDSIANLESFGREADDPAESVPQQPELERKNVPNSMNGGAYSIPENNSNRGVSANGSVRDSSNHHSVDSTRVVAAASAVDDRRQQQQEANPQQPPSFHYAGYTDDYYNDDFDTYTDPYAAPNLLLPKSGSELGGIWCCIFPWLEQKAQPKIRSTPEPDEAASEGNKPRDTLTSSDNAGNGSQQVARDASAAADEDASREGESTNSNVLGERLSDKERQAVLARLRLAQPESIMLHTSNTNGVGNETYVEQEECLKTHDAVEKNGRPTKGLLNGIPVYDKSPLEKIDLNNPAKLKGILKKRSTAKLDESEGDNQSSAAGSNDSNGGPLAGPQQIRKPRRSLFPSYDDRKPRKTSNNVSFALMARVVTVKSKVDMTEEEKSDIWWQRTDYEDFRKAGRIITRAMLEGGSEIWLASNESLLKKKEKGGKTSPTGDTIQAAGDKWWHKFGHSRRGLEHVVSVDEGRQRQVNVKNAIRAVVEEQSRQKMCKREDAEKIRTVALQHTSWARDLALASGASDAHAVESAFSEGRHSREFYLLKMSRSKTTGTSNTSVNVPQFMKPVTEASAPKTPIVQQRLDAFTASQIQYRRRKGGVQPTAASVLAADSTSSDVESMEQVHDAHTTEKGKESLAQQAAGFSADGKKVNMAAVLSGLGAVRVQKTDEKLAAAVMRVAS